VYILTDEQLLSITGGNRPYVDFAIRGEFHSEGLAYMTLKKLDELVREKGDRRGLWRRPG
jgi:hypothetical protein